ncbi:hypothetical protein FB451DRAFT_771356 [Mycena latifolia]|nr:hypothetical protein FB451DRAFT_771356 [Mycena latifolia]
MQGQLTSGKPALTAKKYPSCFYADGSYDPKAPEKGLFRSQFLLRIIRHLWTAPSSAMDGAEKLKKISNARVLGQYRMQGRMVGYGCTQGRTMISTSDWTVKDGAYNYEKLFNSVVELFENDPADPWVVDTLNWFQDGVFSSVEVSGSASDSNDEDDDESSAAIIARRAAHASD